MSTKFKDILDTDLILVATDSFSVAECLGKLNVAVAGGNYKRFYQRIRELEIDIGHFKGQGHLAGRSHSWTKTIPLAEILEGKHPTYLTARLSQRLRKEGGWKHECMECENSEWMGNPIPLELDHINGVRDDHRVENLRLLCCNCHALTDTYAGKNRGAWSRSSVD